MMNLFKALSTTFLLVLSLANVGFAQSPETELTAEQKEEMAQNMAAFVEVLGLSDAQTTEFKAISKKYTTQLMAVKESEDGRFKKYKRAKAIQKEQNAEMEDLLSADQYKLYREKQKEMQKKMKAKRG